VSTYDLVYIFAICLFIYVTYLGVRLRQYKKKEQNSKVDSDWVAELHPDLEALDRRDREAVKALVQGLKNKV
jgi:FixJ family two-component response regulator